MFLVPHSVSPPYMCVDYECSDRIILPETFVASHKLHVDDVIHIKNAYHETIVGAIHATHNRDNVTIFIPSSMYFSFSIYDELVMTKLEKQVPQMIYIQLHSTTFDLIEINKGLLNYKTLTAKKSICVRDLHGLSKLTILRFVPDKINTAYVYNSGSVRVQFMLPDSAPKEFTFLVRPTKVSDDYVPYAGAGRMLDVSGAAPATAESIAAARRRAYGAGAKIE